MASARPGWSRSDGRSRAHRTGRFDASSRTAWSAGSGDENFIFTDVDGRRLHPDLFTQRFDRLVAQSGLPRIRLHDLRHTHATLGPATGVPVSVMSERLGHASSEFTMKQYQHVLPGMQAAAAKQIAYLVGESG